MQFIVGESNKSKKMWQHGDKWQGFDPISDPNFDRNTDPNVDFKLPHIVCVFLCVSDTTFQIHSIVLMVQCVVLAYHPLEINEFRDWLAAYFYICLVGCILSFCGATMLTNNSTYFRCHWRGHWCVIGCHVGHSIFCEWVWECNLSPGKPIMCTSLHHADYRVLFLSVWQWLFYNSWLEEALRHTHYAMIYHATNVQEYMCYPSVFQHPIYL